MSFSAKWLELREPIDHAARNSSVMAEVRTFIETRSIARLTDIGAGTGSTIRALEQATNRPINWHLIDYDAKLLKIAKQASKNGRVTIKHTDLAQTPETVFEQECDLVTTSAFLDLVSKNWLSRFVDLLGEHNLPFYAALTYDGRAAALPPLDDDEIILNAFNAHQRTDKGFGEALGSSAAETTLDLLKKAGFTVSHGLSDWQAGNKHAAFQRHLITGWHTAACEIRPDLKPDFDRWLETRLTLLGDCITHHPSAFVGHVDLFAEPA